MLEESETEKTIGSFVTFLVLVTFHLGGAVPLPPSPWLNLCAGQFCFRNEKILATSEAEFNSSVDAGMVSKPSGKKAAIIFAFRK